MSPAKIHSRIGVAWRSSRERSRKAARKHRPSTAGTAYWWRFSIGACASNRPLASEAATAAAIHRPRVRIQYSRMGPVVASKPRNETRFRGTLRTEVSDWNEPANVPAPVESRWISAAAAAIAKPRATGHNPEAADRKDAGMRSIAPTRSSGAALARQRAALARSTADANP